MQKNNSGANSPSLKELGFSFFKIGLTAYGMAILQQIKALIIERGWLSRQEVDEGLAMVQLYPGPIMFNLATYSAYRKKGFLGALVSSFTFIFPSFLLMLFLSWLYFSYGNLPWVHPLFVLLEAMVIGVVANVFLDFSKRYITNIFNGFIAAVAFLLMLARVQAFVIIVVAIILSMLRNVNNNKPNDAPLSSSITIPGTAKERALGILLTVLFLSLLIFVGFELGEGSLTLAMFKVGAVAFGNGNTIMPLLQQEAVISHHWLTMKEFADGIGFGQITPGPFLITSTFIGYKYGGISGSILATVGMFYPSFLYTLIMTEIYGKIRNLKAVRYALEGLLASFTGMLLFVLLSIGKIPAASPIAYLWSIYAFLLVRFFGKNILTVFVTGLLFGVPLILLKII